jgi:hypothetical protein
MLKKSSSRKYKVVPGGDSNETAVVELQQQPTPPQGSDSGDAREEEAGGGVPDEVDQQIQRSSQHDRDGGSGDARDEESRAGRGDSVSIAGAAGITPVSQGKPGAVPVATGSPEAEAASKLQAVFRRKRAFQKVCDLAKETYEVHYDYDQGAYFFHNTNTGTSSWSKPHMLGKQQLNLGTAAVNPLCEQDFDEQVLQRLDQQRSQAQVQMVDDGTSVTPVKSDDDGAPSEKPSSDARFNEDQTDDDEENKLLVDSDSGGSESGDGDGGDDSQRSGSGSESDSDSGSDRGDDLYEDSSDNESFFMDEFENDSHLHIQDIGKALNASKERKSLLQRSVVSKLEALMNYTQMFALIYSLDVNWPPMFELFFGWFRYSILDFDPVYSMTTMPIFPLCENATSFTNLAGTPYENVTYVANATLSIQEMATPDAAYVGSLQIGISLLFLPMIFKLLFSFWFIDDYTEGRPVENWWKGLGFRKFALTHVPIVLLIGGFASLLNFGLNSTYSAVQFSVLYGGLWLFIACVHLGVNQYTKFLVKRDAEFSPVAYVAKKAIVAKSRVVLLISLFAWIPMNMFIVGTLFPPVSWTMYPAQKSYNVENLFSIVYPCHNFDDFTDTCSRCVGDFDNTPVVPFTLMIFVLAMVPLYTAAYPICVYFFCTASRIDYTKLGYLKKV